MMHTTVGKFALCVSLAVCGQAAAGQPAVQTTDTGKLTTWWHAAHELNDSAPVADDAVRRSTVYDVKVATAVTPQHRYDSYTYMSIPRGGRGKWGYEGRDGAEFADEANLTMSWSSFVYSDDVWVHVTLKDGSTIHSADEVKIRPGALNFEKAMVDERTVKIRVPYSPDGYRFSVEFDNQLYTAYNDLAGVSGELNSAGNGAAVHTEPRNAMLVFAEPRLTGQKARELIPNPSSGAIYYPPQGRIDNLDAITQDTVYFKPGTYYMPWNYHAKLPASVKWVYLAPGAYVKGAFQFMSETQKRFKVTGYGVLSGEKYVYEPDTDNHYQHRAQSNCHGSCVKMLRFSSTDAQQELDLQGVTIAEPPYHSFVVYGNEDTFKMRVDSYKQVGGWYWQTDGIELYTGGAMRNTFFHANDDVLKIYHSNLDISNTVIWKNENGPVIQWGWSPRDIDNVHVKDTHVIHNRMYWKDEKINTCVLNASPHWDANGRPDASKWVRNLFFENITVEGKTNCAIRLYALQNTEKVHVKNLLIDGWNELPHTAQASRFRKLSGALAIGNEAANGAGLKLENYRVGGEYVTKHGDNWRDSALGRLNFDGELWDSWNAWVGDGAP
ncbi:family 49 glycosyl hydrolase [Pseudoduganella namucuonensis]|uniref:Glycosyl hydrolase family 49 n=1 Tax=Pseudoduganella namucuonensis TaxID=1035707 RepID=A0A1I7FIL9_9BURK|nr:family 49 glycosyl hydrolase [Pseudoduganella namucuonensis]SFU36027.1 Glycosyl hydrolase family 49 [Pseudoduganella namucuonensis]